MELFFIFTWLSILHTQTQVCFCTLLFKIATQRRRDIWRLEIHSETVRYIEKREINDLMLVWILVWSYLFVYFFQSIDAMWKKIVHGIIGCMKAFILRCNVIKTKSNECKIGSEAQTRVSVLATRSRNIGKI